MRRLSLAVLAIVAAVGAASAHVASGPVPLASSVEPFAAVAIAAAAIAYWLGSRRLRSQAIGRIAGPSEVAAFLGGCLTLVAALLSPIDGLSHDLFSVHMLQHLLLMLAAAPLFVWARTPLVFFWALPRRARRSLGRWWTGSGAGSGLRMLRHPLVVWIVFCAAFVFWHLPGPYAAALDDEAIHTVEHLSLFLSAYGFWSIVMERSERGRLDYGGRLLFVSTAAVLSGLPGALLILASRPFFPVHAAGVAKWGLTLAEDQEIAGLIMWIPAGFVYLAAIAVLFVLWLRAAERRADLRAARLAALAPVLLMAILLAGCDEANQEARASVADGDPERGASLIVEVGCGSCHTIPGIRGANALVGPPLDHMGRRIFIAGLLRNNPDNMLTWLKNPQAVVPGNAMPYMALSDEQARDIAAYLYTLD